MLHNNLGSTLAKRQMPRDAEKCYLEALRFCSELPPGHDRGKKTEAHIRKKLADLREGLFPIPGLKM